MVDQSIFRWNTGMFRLVYKEKETREQIKQGNEEKWNKQYKDYKYCGDYEIKKWNDWPWETFFKFIIC